MHQREGHPCRLERDAAGASECKQGLTCYNSDNHSATRGKGTCTRLQKLSRSNQICDISLGVDACESSYACYSTNGRGNDRISAGTVATGLCQKSVRFSRLDEICDASFGANACVDDYQCRSANGREISRGIGFCRRSSAVIPAKFANRNQACNIGHGLEACESSYACYANNRNQRIRTGICLGVVRRAGLGGVCNVSYGPDACVAGYECLGDNGRREVRGGFGVCARLNTSGRTNSGNSGGCLPAGASWAVDCTNSRSCASGSCLKNCVQGSDRYFCY